MGVLGDLPPVTVCLDLAVVLLPALRIAQVVNVIAHGEGELICHQSLAHQLQSQLIRHLPGHHPGLDRIVDKDLLIRRMNLTANQVTDESAVSHEPAMEQMDLFTDYAAAQAERKAQEAELAKERKLQETMLGIKSKYGKNELFIQHGLFVLGELYSFPGDTGRLPDGRTEAGKGLKTCKFCRFSL